MTPDTQPISITKQWIQDIVIGQALCPPLIKLVRERCGDKLDWQILQQWINIHDLTGLGVGDRLLHKSSEIELDFILNADQPNVPLTSMLILPQMSNGDYDQFGLSLQRYSIPRVLREMDDRIRLSQIFVAATNAFGMEEKFENVPQYVALGDIDVTSGMIGAIFDNFFSPVYFYGNPILDQELVGMESPRGPVERQKYLSRAPYPILQFINPINAIYLTEGLNRPKLYARNTNLALEPDALSDLEQKMQEYRGPK